MRTCGMDITKAWARAAIGRVELGAAERHMRACIVLHHQVIRRCQGDFGALRFVEISNYSPTAWTLATVLSTPMLLTATAWQKTVG